MVSSMSQTIAVALPHFLIAIVISYPLFMFVSINITMTNCFGNPAFPASPHQQPPFHFFNNSALPPSLTTCISCLISLVITVSSMAQSFAFVIIILCHYPCNSVLIALPTTWLGHIHDPNPFFGIASVPHCLGNPVYPASPSTSAWSPKSPQPLGFNMSKFPHCPRLPVLVALPIPPVW